MHRILVIAKDQETAVKAEALIGSGIDIARVYPGVKSFPAHFDAVAIFFETVEELATFEAERKRYANAPLRAFLGNDQPSDLEGATYFSSSNAMLTHFQAEHKSLNESIRKVFEEFDADKSGFIDLAELKMVSKNLGREMDDAELDECIKDLDTNNDGKISFEEFRTWWLSGRQNLSPWMKRLINFQIQTSKVLSIMNGPLAKALGNTEDARDISTSSLTINLNKVEHAGTTISAKFQLLSKAQKEEYLRIKSRHSFPQLPDFLTDVLVSASFKFKEGKAEEASSNINGLLSFIDQISSIASVVTEGDKLCIGVALPQLSSAMGPSLLGPYEEMIKVIQDELQVEQSVEASLRLGASPADLANEGNAPADEILKGVSFEVRLNLWRKVNDIITKLLEAKNEEIGQFLTTILSGVSPAFLLRVNATVDVHVDDYMRQKLAENPMIGMFLGLTTGQLIAMGAKLKSDDELNAALEKYGPFASLITFFFEHLGNEIEIDFAHPLLGAKVSLRGEGLGDVLKTAAKFAPLP